MALRLYIRENGGGEPQISWVTTQVWRLTATEDDLENSSRCLPSWVHWLEWLEWMNKVDNGY